MPFVDIFEKIDRVITASHCIYASLSLSELILTSWRPGQNGCHFADIFRFIFLFENCYVCTKFVPGGLINNIPALVQIMAWCSKRHQAIVWTNDDQVYITWAPWVNILNFSSQLWKYIWIFLSFLYSEMVLIIKIIFMEDQTYLSPTVITMAADGLVTRSQSISHFGIDPVLHVLLEESSLSTLNLRLR